MPNELENSIDISYMPTKFHQNRTISLAVIAIQTNIHTYIHTYLHTYIHTNNVFRPQLDLETFARSVNK
jgi:hypothetical protein